MSILATDKKLISFGTDYSAGSGISIIDHTISIVPSAVGKTYSAGPNIDIYQQDDDYYISGKDWSNEISDASANSYTQSTSYFNNWINGQYTGDITNITNNLTSLSGDLSSYYKKTETSSKEQISDAIQYVSAHAVGDVEVNNYVHNNSATIDEVNSAYKANSASYITAHQSLEGYATEEWVESKGYITGVNIPESATWNEASNVVSSNSASWSQGKTYEGVSPIVVNNNENKISADTWTLSAGVGISFTENSANKVTRIDVDLPQQDLSYISAQVDSANQSVNSLSSSLSLLSSTVNTNSGTWNEVSSKVDTTALIPTIDSNTITYSSKPTEDAIYASDNDLKNVNSIQGKSNLALVPNVVLQVPNVITATNTNLIVENIITASNGNLTLQNSITAIKNDTFDMPGVITAKQGGLTANGLSANNDGLTANGLTADAMHSGFSAMGISAGKQGPFIIQGSHESISSNNEVGFIFSSDNTNFNSATLTIAEINNTVGMPSPKFEARNISGAGFSIEASGAKGYDKNGNVVWDTSNPQVKNIISYSDTKTAAGGLNGNIILTTMPSTNANNLTSSPYVIMDANQVSYFASYGPSAQTPTVSLKPDSITFALPTGNSGRTTVGYNDIKQELSGSSWTLTGSIQKRELEYDSNTSAITAINGSALAGQGGGGSVSSKYGTISVDGSNIEATNKAIEFNSNGFTSSFGYKAVDNNEPLVLTWDNYSQGTIISVNAFNTSNETGTLSYSSNTDVTGEVTVNSFNTSNINVQIPNATAIRFTTDKSFEFQGDTRVTAPSSFKVSELAWKSDLPTYEYDSNHKVSAINGSALVGNEDYLVEQGFVKNLTSPKGTISVFNNNKIEGTNSAIASDVIDGFVSAYNGFIVQPGNSSTLTWERYVPNTMLFVSGQENYQDHTLTYSADTDVTGTITVPTGGQVSVEIPSGATSIVIGNEDWSRILYNLTVSADNYYEIGELAWASAIPTYEYDSTNKISAINGSALTDVNLNNIVQTNSGSWGGSALPISAGPGIKVNLVDNTLVFSNDETVLFETTAVYGAGVCNLSESLKNFERIGVKPTRGYNGTPNPGGAGPWNYFDTDQIVGGTTEPFQAVCPYIMEYINWKVSQYNPNSDCTVLTWNKGFQKNMQDNRFFTASSFTDCVGIQKVIGINRK